MMRVLCMVLASLCLAPGLNASPTQEVAELVAEMGKPDWKISAYRELRKRKDPAMIPLIAQSIERFDHRGQLHGVYLLELFEPPQVRAVFDGLRAAEDPHLRFLVGRYRHVQGEREGATEMAASLVDPSFPAGRVGFALDRIKGVAHPAIEEAVVHWARVDVDVGPCRSAIRYLNSVDHVVHYRKLRGLLEHPKPVVRVLAGAFLSRFDPGLVDGVAAEILEGAMVGRGDWDQLHEIFRTTRMLPEVVAQAVGERLRAEDAARRIHDMLRIFATFDPTPAKRAFRELLDHKDAKVREAAFFAIDRYQGWSISDLTTMLAMQDDLQVIRAADALRRMDDKTGIPAVVERVRGDAKQRSEAVRVVAAFRQPEVVEPLLQALLDKEAAVRTEARDGLERVLWTLFPYRKFDLTSIGYEPEADEAIRRRAVSQLRTWWEANRSADW